MCWVDTGKFINLQNCVVRDEFGIILAHLREEEDYVVVNVTDSCPPSMHLYIVHYLRELGFLVKDEEPIK